MAEPERDPIDTAAELLESDPEAARDLLEVGKKDRGQGDLQRPPRDDPRHGDLSVAPGQDDVPAGGTSGRHIRGGRPRRGG
ncbi:MAG TPA: hypothetical protein VFN57_00640 [Thermomicrobiaceae bacterium]|nr:hypothetical protein [Thermomicrobiaceae bacterium]